MQTFSAWLARLALGLLLLGALGMIAAMLVGVADVVGTEFLGRPVLGTRCSRSTRPSAPRWARHRCPPR